MVGPDLYVFRGSLGVQDVCPDHEDNQDLCCKKADCEDNAEKSSGPLSLIEYDDAKARRSSEPVSEWSVTA